MKVGVLNGGGECAELNAAERVVRRSDESGCRVIDAKHDWVGLFDAAEMA